MANDKVKVATSKLTALADAIRAKSGGSEEITLGDIPNIIVDSISVPEKSFGEATFEEMGKMMEAHSKNKINVFDYWSLGDKKRFELVDDVPTESERVGTLINKDTCIAELILVGKYHHMGRVGYYENTDKRTLCTMLVKITTIDPNYPNDDPSVGIRSTIMNDGGPYNVSFSSTPVYSWLNNKLLRAFPQDLKKLMAYIRSDDVVSSLQTNSNYAKITLPVLREFTTETGLTDNFGSNYKNYLLYDPEGYLLESVGQGVNFKNLLYPYYHGLCRNRSKQEYQMCFSISFNQNPNNDGGLRLSLQELSYDHSQAEVLPMIAFGLEGVNFVSRD